ncbi:MAG: Co2+/Mg2+ efflux protein ApaG [Ignavibacteriae bacterium HGW-Ignavibacteriae-1]|jgi:ApaG protein|nr:Co2+/Mg2+ efflux protein ApaG [Candidatus Kapabacteria bacterium]PKL85228.1 MAG: Co2+/Mg2+ efflux protein ApaG [Ignavibacteriae bacterium HGW-Ignavibacteriae-1]
MNTKNQKITNEILVEVVTEYISPDRVQGDSRNFFAYTVTLTNLGKKQVQLLSRHWIIINADGNRDEVRGDGVVGFTPKLFPGQTFTYTSNCPMDTEWGTMEGEYTFITDEGVFFQVEIPRFYLVIPALLSNQ